MKSLLLVFTAAMLGGGCGSTSEDPEQQRAYVIYSDQVFLDGTYGFASQDSGVSTGVVGNLIEDVVKCEFRDVRIITDHEGMHGSPLSIWLPESAVGSEQRQCLKNTLPAHATMSGPYATAELSLRSGL